MKFTQIRSATVIIEFGGKRFLVDPMLADKDSYPGFPFSVNSHIFWPRVDLPVPAKDLLDVDAIILTHFHPDHWDDAATAIVPKDKLIFTQNERDASILASFGFTNLRTLSADNTFEGVRLQKTEGRHGVEELFDGPFAEAIGDVCGLIFTHPDEKTLYLAGDTIWYAGVKANIETHRPDVIIVNSCDARMIEPTLGETSIIMGTDDVHKVCEAAPWATVVASHMDVVNHACLDRAGLKAFLDDNGLAQQVRIPADGESLRF